MDAVLKIRAALDQCRLGHQLAPSQADTLKEAYDALAAIERAASVIPTEPPGARADASERPLLVHEIPGEYGIPERYTIYPDGWSRHCGSTLQYETRTGPLRAKLEKLERRLKEASAAGGTMTPDDLASCFKYLEEEPDGVEADDVIERLQVHAVAQGERVKLLEEALAQARSDAAEYRRAMNEIGIQRDVAVTRAEGLEAEISRLKPSGQVAEDAELLRETLEANAVHATSAPKLRAGGPHGAISRIATRAHGYDAFVTACREALGPHRSTGTPADVAKLHTDLDAARAFSFHFERERDVARADNAILVEDMKRAYATAMHLETFPKGITEVWEAMRKAWQPHPGAALLEQHRNEVESLKAEVAALVKRLHESCPACRGELSHVVGPPNGDGTMKTPCSMPVHTITREHNLGAELLEEHRKEIARWQLNTGCATPGAAGDALTNIADLLGRQPTEGIPDAIRRLREENRAAVEEARRVGMKEGADFVLRGNLAPGHSEPKSPGKQVEEAYRRGRDDEQLRAAMAKSQVAVGEVPLPARATIAYWRMMLANRTPVSQRDFSGLLEAYVALQVELEKTQGKVDGPARGDGTNWRGVAGIVVTAWARELERFGGGEIPAVGAASRLWDHGMRAAFLEQLVSATRLLGQGTATALDIAHRHGGTDGAQHKAWVLDQMVRALTGPGYAQWVSAHKAGEDGPDTYTWDEGDSAVSKHMSSGEKRDELADVERLLDGWRIPPGPLPERVRRARFGPPDDGEEEEVVPIDSATVRNLMAQALPAMERKAMKLTSELEALRPRLEQCATMDRAAPKKEFNVSIIPFDFEQQQVRVIVDERGEPWFVAADVARVLGYRDAANATRSVPDDEKGTHGVSTPGGQQQMLMVSEPGVYRLVFTSRVDGAERFKRWLAHDVLPSIRKTGSYAVPSQPLPEVSALMALSKAQLLRMAAELQEQVEKQELLLAAQAPKVEAHARFMDASGTLSLRDSAKVLGAREHPFIKYLLREQVLYRTPGDGRLRAYAHLEERGYFRHRAGASEKSGKAYTQVRVTPAGLDWLSQKLGEQASSTDGVSE